MVWMEQKPTPARKKMHARERFFGPSAVVFTAVALALPSQMGVMALGGYQFGMQQTKMALALGVLGILQLLFAATACGFLLLTNVVDPGSVELFPVPSEPAADEQAPPPPSTASKKGRKQGDPPAPPVQQQTTSKRVLPDGTEVTFRWCWHCSLWRPPMANHCPTCHRCFLDLDHHCPWVGNCVAAHNIRFFYLMLFWFALATITIPAGFVAFAAGTLADGATLTDMRIVIFVIGGVAALYLLCCCGGIWINAAAQLTTIGQVLTRPRINGAQREQYEAYQTQVMSRRADFGTSPPSEFDRFKANVCSPITLRQH